MLVLNLANILTKSFLKLHSVIHQNLSNNKGYLSILRMQLLHLTGHWLPTSTTSRSSVSSTRKSLTRLILFLKRHWRRFNLSSPSRWRVIYLTQVPLIKCLMCLNKGKYIVEFQRRQVQHRGCESWYQCWNLKFSGHLTFQQASWALTRDCVINKINLR